MTQEQTSWRDQRRGHVKCHDGLVRSFAHRFEYHCWLPSYVDLNPHAIQARRFLAPGKGLHLAIELFSNVNAIQVQTINYDVIGHLPAEVTMDLVGCRFSHYNMDCQILQVIEDDVQVRVIGVPKEERACPYCKHKTSSYMEIRHEIVGMGLKELINASN